MMPILMIDNKVCSSESKLNFLFLENLLKNIFQKYTINPCDENFGFMATTKIIKSYLLEGDAMYEFIMEIETALKAQVIDLINNSPEISEEDLELDGIYRKYVNFMEHKVLLDRHTSMGGRYYFLKGLSDNINKEIAQNGSIGILYLKE